LLFGKDAKRAIGDRVYIHRIGSSRRVRNFGQIEPVLKRLGFSIAVFDDVPLTQQIAAMSAAEYVIGEHGAGMANVQFCQPGTPVLEMFNPSCIQPHFWSVASARGLRYGFIAGAHANGGTPGWNTDYIVDPGALEQAVDAMRSIPRKMPATC
jgi:capsular polysaccharide biosynthesis protein